MKKYYEVNAKCGHVGRNNYINISFPITAENGKEAALICRNMGRVKHHRKDAINYVEEISYDEYITLQKNNRNDSYLYCKNKQMQNKIGDLYLRINFADECDSCEEEKTRCIEYKLKKQKMIFKNAIKEINDCLLYV